MRRASDVTMTQDSRTPTSKVEPDLPPFSTELHRLLEEDLLRRGCIIPVVVDEDGAILDGRIRAAICDRHKLPYLKIVAPRLSGEEKADLRTALNVFRRQLSREQVRECIRWELRRTPESSDRGVAGRIGCSPTTVGAVRRTIQDGQLDAPRVGRDGRKRAMPKPVVYTTCNAQVKEAARILPRIVDLPGGPISLRKLRNLAFQEKMRQEDSSPVAKLPAEITIEVSDFRDFAWGPYEGRAAMVMADPPWLDDHAELRRPFVELAGRLLRPGGVVCCYTGTYGLPGWFEAFLAEKNLKYVWTVASVNQKDGKVRVHGKGKVPIQSAWRPILIYSKGEMEGGRVLFDVIQSSTQEKTHHPWQQPVEESLRLIKTFTKPGDLIIDPTCGSGSSGCACVIAGQGRRYLGLDRDPRSVRKAKLRVAEAVEQARSG